MNKKYFISFVVIAFSIFVLPLQTQAAGIFFGAQNKTVGVGQKFEVGVFVSSTRESINAIEATITFPSNAVELSSFYTGSSILAFWIQQPTVTSPGNISFSGIVPGGFIGDKGYLFSAVFTAKKEGTVSIGSTQEKILLNDGNGTQTTATQAPLKITIAKSAPNTFTSPSDATQPEIFFPAVSNDPSIFGGKYFVAFATQDKGIGIDHYEIAEKGLLSFKKQFVPAESPYLLHDQLLLSTIYIKAVDKTGNERIVTLAPPHLLLYAISGAFGIIVLTGIILFLRVWKKIKRKR